MDEATKLFSAGNWPEAIAAYQSIVDREPTNALALIRLARSSAAMEDKEQALVALKGWVATGSASYTVAMKLPEFDSLRSDPRFIALMVPLKPCNAAEFRHFDFWLGEWDVESVAAPGTISRNRITAVYGGCTLREEYVTPAGYEGTSLSFYDAARKVWHQTWIDNQGGALYLEGGVQGEAMVMEATMDPDTVNRVTWTPLPDGRVRQHWESKAGDARTWTTVFDGYYTRRKAP
ncbi:MAG: tetratricopeptide repeat protein [Steroidobacteraceae bacterium]